MFVFWNLCARAKLHKQKRPLKLCSVTLNLICKCTCIVSYANRRCIFNREITTTWYYVNSSRHVDSEKIRVLDGIWTHDPPWSSRMLYHWATGDSGEQGSIIFSLFRSWWTGLACVAWRFLSNFRALEKRGSRDKELQDREEPGRETTEKPPTRMAGIFVSPVRWPTGHCHWIRRLTR